MPTEIEQLQNDIKLLKGEVMELNKAVLGYMYYVDALQEVVITNDTDRIKVGKLVQEKMGKYSKQLHASIARVEGNDVLYRLFKNPDSDSDVSS